MNTREVVIAVFVDQKGRLAHYMNSQHLIVCKSVENIVKNCQDYVLSLPIADAVWMIVMREGVDVMIAAGMGAKTYENFTKCRLSILKAEGFLESVLIDLNKDILDSMENHTDNQDDPHREKVEVFDHCKDGRCQ